MEIRTKFLGFSIIGLLLTGTLPAFAEVSELSTNERMYFLDDDIVFEGKVDPGTTGLVTIVIRDSNNNFVLLTQAIINPDDTFEKRVEINNKFTTHGGYNATGFILNMTDGAQTTFDVSTDGSLFSYEEEQQVTETEQTTVVITPISIPDSTSISVQKFSGIADFVDPDKDPQYYLDRYYNEPGYKSWFDTYYTDITIEEAVGYEEPKSMKDEITEIITEEIIPEEVLPDAEAISAPTITSTNESEISGETTQMALAIGGLGILLGAVYGVKRKVDSNTEQISKNRDTIKKKLLGGILSNDPSSLIRERLAKGEITIEEYNQLKKTLSCE